MYLYDNLLMVDVPSGYYGMLVIIIFEKKNKRLYRVLRSEKIQQFFIIEICVSDNRILK